MADASAEAQTKPASEDEAPKIEDVTDGVAPTVSEVAGPTSAEPAPVYKHKGQRGTKGKGLKNLPVRGEGM